MAERLTPMSDEVISRRELVIRVSALLGGAALVGSSRLMAAIPSNQAAANRPANLFTDEQVAVLDEIAETILPQTHTPGAKAAGCGAFMALMVTDCYAPADQRIFREGLNELDSRARELFGVPFRAASPDQRHSLLTVLDQEALRIMDERTAAQRFRLGLAPEPGTTATDPAAAVERPIHYFRMMKELALLGYFTSQIGCTQAQRYVETPGRFDACLPYRAGDPAWATHA